MERRASIEAVREQEALLTGGRWVAADFIVAMTGYRPDLAFLGELALEIDPIAEGSGRLAGDLANVTDCLSVPAVAPDDLASGEPRIHLIGAKSYGRSRTFLLRSGYAHVDTILASLVNGV